MVPDVTSAPTRAAREAISRFDDDVGTHNYVLYFFVLFFVYFSPRLRVAFDVAFCGDLPSDSDNLYELPCVPHCFVCFISRRIV